jgi:hypothetical protein
VGIRGGRDGSMAWSGGQGWYVWHSGESLACDCLATALTVHGR